MTSGQSPPWTILKVLRWAETHLAQKGISEPRAAAGLLLAHCLQCTRLELYLRYDQPLSEAELQCYKRLLRRRLAREPVQYIVGRQEFWSLEFLVTPAVLIPRPETELLVEAVLHHAQTAPGETLRILDVGTGSGAVAVALAKELPQARVTALDASEAALAVARQNSQRHGVQARLNFIRSDLLSALDQAATFDVIVANLPYVPTPDWEQLPPEIKDHEPRLALDGGPDGLEVLHRLILAVPSRLRAGGFLALEVGQGQAETVVQLLEATWAFTSLTIIPDYQGHGRVVTAVRRQAPEPG